MSQTTGFEWLMIDASHIRVHPHGTDADVLFADYACDTNAIIKQATNADIEIVLPSRKNRKEPGRQEEYLYTLRLLVENTFLMLKRWRVIAARYAKNSDSFSAAV